MKKVDYEHKTRKDAAKETILYGVVWVFLALLVSGIPLLDMEFNLLYIAVSIFLFIEGVRKLVKGTRRLKELKKSAIERSDKVEMSN